MEQEYMERFSMWAWGQHKDENGNHTKLRRREAREGGKFPGLDPDCMQPHSKLPQNFPWQLQL